MPRPAGSGPITRKQIVELVARLKASELEKSQCGHRVLSWYATQAAVLGGTK